MNRFIADSSPCIVRSNLQVFNKKLIQPMKRDSADARNGPNHEAFKEAERYCIMVVRYISLLEIKIVLIIFLIFKDKEKRGNAYKIC